jgi:hypothetical protein
MSLKVLLADTFIVLEICDGANSTVNVGIEAVLKITRI